MRPRESFHAFTLGQFKEAVKPSHNLRARFTEMRKSLRVALLGRDRADARSERFVQGVVHAVTSHPSEGPDGKLYAAMGYVRTSASRRGRKRKKKPRT